MTEAPDRCSLRQKIRSVTDDMAACVAAEDWRGAAELGSLRLNLLEALFAGGAVSPADEVELIEVILEADRSLNELAAASRREVLVELDDHRRARKGINAYRDNASAGS